jgi:hypothetical protein
MSLPATTVTVLPPKLEPTALSWSLVRRSVVLLELKRSPSVVFSAKPTLLVCRPSVMLTLLPALAVRSPAGLHVGGRGVEVFAGDQAQVAVG